MNVAKHVTTMKVGGKRPRGRHRLRWMDRIKEETKTGYLMGDFNIDLLKVNLHAKTNEFVNDVISQGFLPKITRPTRITPHSATLIDHIYIQMTTGLHLKMI